MATAQQWVLVCGEIRSAPDPNRSPAVRQLYQMAIEDGAKALRRFGFSSAVGEDLVHELLASKLELIVAADSPRAYYVAAVMNAACSEKRRRRKKHEPFEEAESRLPAVENDPSVRLDDARLLMRLSERERRVLRLVAEGWSREDVAAEFATTRPNIDQIVSRARRKLQEER